MADTAQTVPFRATILINVEHPIFVRMAALPREIAAPLLRHACQRALNLAQHLDAALLRQALQGARS